MNYFIILSEERPVKNRLDTILTHYETFNADGASPLRYMLYAGNYTMKLGRLHAKAGHMPDFRAAY